MPNGETNQNSQSAGRGNLRFRPCTARELDTIRESAARYKITLPLDSPKICVVEQDNFTVVHLRTGNVMRTGASKRNPLKQKILQISFRVGPTSGWTVYRDATAEEAIQRIMYTREGRQVTNVRFRYRVEEKDKPNPHIGQQVALARAVRNCSIRID